MGRKTGKGGKIICTKGSRKTRNKKGKIVCKGGK